MSFPPRSLGREDIVRFAREWDPQPFHLDEEAAPEDPLRGPGGQRMAHGLPLDAHRGGWAPRGQHAAWGRPGWRSSSGSGRSVRTIRSTLTVEVLEARPSRSKPDRGSVKLGYVLVNGAGEPVFSMVAWVMFGRRTPGRPED